MKKLLATGLIASVAMASAETYACGNGGFYVGANFGVAFSKAKATNEKATHETGKPYGAEASGWKIGTIARASKAISKEAAEKRSELAVAEMNKKKKKTKFAAEVVLGYDCRLNDAMLGIELNVGGIFGTNKLKRPDFTITLDNAMTAQGANVAGGASIVDNSATAGVEIEGEDYAKVKEQWHIALMPRVGYLFTPQFEGYVTFGGKLAKFKTDVNDLPFVATVHEDGVGDCNHKLEMKSMSKKSTKAVFVAGVGARYEFDPSFFAKLEYNFEFGAKPKLHKEAMPEVKKIKVTTHVVKLGLGYRF